MILLQILFFLLGVALVTRVLLSALYTFVLPRGAADKLVRWFFLRMRALFQLRSHWTSSYSDFDRVWALFAPTVLILLPVVWVILTLTGYTLIFWALGVGDLHTAFRTSGSSLLTLGFAVPTSGLQTVVVFSEAGIGLGLVAILISYLPTIYSAWSRREQLVNLLDVRAGSPPTPINLFRRFYLLESMDTLNALWTGWEVWFTDIEETHTSLSFLSLLRSTQADRSWVAAAGCVLDSASLVYSSIDLPRDPQAALVIRSGTLSLRRICDLFRLPYSPDPHYPDDPISVTRQEYDAVYDELLRIGVPMIADREQAWRDFAGWRVNYDIPLRALAGLTLAPPSPWSTDRPIRYPHSRWG